jgi:hypothetical protein
MISFSPNEIDKILYGTEFEKTVSALGFFSKPFRIYHADKELIVKLYSPIRNNSLVSSIIKNHNDYMSELKFIGLKVPETFITTKPTGNKHQLIIIQEAFQDDELLRNRIIEASLSELTNMCFLIFDDITKFWKRKKNSLDIGFHPTLRNYSLHDGNLWFFDTFPPMLMDQRKLNHLILKMSPYGGWIKNLVPLRFINKVTDEYYHFDKMFIGVVGSCCRLRPDDAGKILSFSNEYITDTVLLSDPEKASILKLLKRPPDLSKIWILIRKLSGNIGSPNIKSPA